MMNAAEYELIDKRENKRYEMNRSINAHQVR